MKQLNRSKRPVSRLTLKHKKLLIGLMFAIIASILYTQIYTHTKAARFEKELQRKEQQIEKQLKNLNDVNNKSIDQQKVIDELNRTKQELVKQLEARRNTSKVYAQEVLGVPEMSSKNCGDNPYKIYIYFHESGCRTTALNSIGCYGIGQSCPRDKIAHCGADFGCQDAWFSNYAIQRYGSWEKAYNFWVQNRWW